MRDKVLKVLSNASTDNKVTISFKVFPNTKELFEKVCKKDGYKVSSVLNILTETYIEEFFESEYKDIRNIMRRIDEIYQIVEEHDTTRDYAPILIELDDLKDKLFKENETIFSLNTIDTHVSTDDGDYDEKYIPEFNTIHSSSIIPMDKLVLISSIKHTIKLLKEEK